MKYIILLSFFFIFQLFHAQINEVDLKKKNLKEIVSIYFDPKTDTIIMKNCANELLSRGKNNKDYNEIAYGYMLMQKMHYGQIALRYNDSCYKYFSKTGNNDFIMGSLLERANILNYDLNKKVEALNLYLKIYNNPKNNKEFLNIDVLEKIATIKSEDLGKFEESIKLYKKVSNYYRKSSETKKFDAKAKYYWSLFTIASNYKDLNILDSSSYYNKLGYKLSKENNYSCYNCLFTLNQAAVDVLDKKFLISLDSINKSIPLLKACRMNGNLAAAYYYKAKNYEGLNNQFLAVENYKKMDSLFADPNILNPKFNNGYKYLINYYKKKKDLENQLIYINKFVTIDSILQSKNNHYKDLLKDKYEIPQLLAEKQKIINSLDKKSSSLKTYLTVTFLIIFLLIIISNFQYYKARKLKTRFENLINELNSENSNNQNKSRNNSINLGIPVEVFENIVEKLKVFEKEKKFLDSNLTLEKLSSNFESNSKYLSKVVNIAYEKTFPNYLNELRINYIIKELNTNRILRNYTISALSKEAGFNNSDSFSAAFAKITGMKPSFFIKELNKIKNV